MILHEKNPATTRWRAGHVIFMLLSYGHNQKAIKSFNFTTKLIIIMKNVGKISIIFFKKMFEPNLFKVFSFLLLLFSVGCAEPVSIIPPCTSKVRCNIDVPTAFIGLCSKFFEGGDAKNLRVEVTVDGVSMDSNKVTTKLLDKYTFNKTNDFSTGGQFSIFKKNYYEN